VSVPSSELGTPPPPLQASVSPPGTQRGGGERVRGLGGPNADDWIESLALCILCGTIHFRLNNGDGPQRMFNVYE
jgi:hypothetical protein